MYACLSVNKMKVFFVFRTFRQVSKLDGVAVCVQ